jgi:DNA polymerase
MPEQKILHIDIKTQSSVDLDGTNAYRYTESPDFNILLISYAYNGGNVRTIDLAHGEKLPGELMLDLTNDAILKMAYNASFERICLSRLLLKDGEYLNPEAWRCTKIFARYFNLPATKDITELCKALGVAVRENDILKGRLLTQRYGRAVRDVHTIPVDEDWNTLKADSRQCVITEQAVWQNMYSSLLKAPSMYYPGLFKEYAVSERINDRGIKLDVPFAEKMAQLASDFKTQRTVELELLCDMYAANHEKGRITDVNSPDQIKTLLDIPSLERDQIRRFFKDLPNDAKQILVMRESILQSANAKYDRMLACVSKDGRLRGEFNFYGASTGRFSGNNVQNLQKNHFEDIEKARADYMSEKAPVTMHYLSDIGGLVRTTLVPEENSIFSDTDYSSIEARVIAWIAGEKWVLDAFNEGRDIYSETASRIYSLIKNEPVTVEKDGINAELRDVGKVATLSCQYGGGPAAFEKMGGNRLGLTKDQMNRIVTSWREANPNIKNLWYGIDNVVKNLIRGGREGFYAHEREPAVPPDMKFAYRKNPFLNDGTFQLEITLPVTHRVLIYPDIRLETIKDKVTNASRQAITYQTPKGKVSIYGGKFAENIVQGVARDILVNALSKLQRAGYPVVMHIHDEVLAEYPKDCVDEISGILASAAEPYTGLPLRAEGFTCNFFRKE